MVVMVKLEISCEGYCEIFSHFLGLVIHTVKVLVFLAGFECTAEPLKRWGLQQESKMTIFLFFQ